MITDTLRTIQSYYHYQLNFINSAKLIKVLFYQALVQEQTHLINVSLFYPYIIRQNGKEDPQTFQVKVVILI